MTAASDAHHHAAIGTAYTILNTDDFSVHGILAQIVKSNELNQQYLTPKDSVRKTWNNWMRLRRRKSCRWTSRRRSAANGGRGVCAPRAKPPAREFAAQGGSDIHSSTNDSAACAIPPTEVTGALQVKFSHT